MRLLVCCGVSEWRTLLTNSAGTPWINTPGTRGFKKLAAQWSMGFLPAAGIHGEAPPTPMTLPRVPVCLIAVEAVLVSTAPTPTHGGQVFARKGRQRNGQSLYICDKSRTHFRGRGLEAGVTRFPIIFFSLPSDRPQTTPRYSDTSELLWFKDLVLTQQ